MRISELYLPSAEERRAHGGKKLLRARPSQWLWVIVYMMSLSLTGLEIYGALAFSLCMILICWRSNREEALVMLGVLVTCTAFVPVHRMEFDFLQLTLLSLAFMGLFFYRKNKLIKQVVLIILLFCAYTFGMALLSDETLKVQFINMRQYWGLLYFIFPLWAFANCEFRFDRFMRAILMYFIVICGFYALDAFVIRGAVFVPSSEMGYIESSIHTSIYFFLESIPRKYPHGMYLITLVPYILARHYKLRPLHWVILLAGLAAPRSSTLVFGFFITLVVFQGHFRQFLKYAVLVIALGVTLYIVDISTGEHMRVASTVKQFTDLADAKDDEDLAKFGSTRMAQVLPKYEALVEQGCLVQGFGFLHPKLTTLPRYRIENELYTNPNLRDEAVATTEVSQFNTVLHIGLLGLVLQTFVFLLVYWRIRRTPHAQFYLAALMCASVIGIAGGYGLNVWRSMMWVSMTLGVVLLYDRRGYHITARPEYDDAPEDADTSGDIITENKDAVGILKQ